MSPAEAATATGHSRLTILKWIRSGRLVAQKIETKNGPGYDIRPEDLTQALQTPRKKKDAPAVAPVRGSVLEALEQLTKAVDEQRREIHDLRGQLAQTEQRLSDAMRALPQREKVEPLPPKKQGWLSRLLRKDQT
jgi:predicted site-specific integrase-resolvase